MQRLADRYAIWFTPLTLAVCGAAWFASGDVDAGAGRPGGGHPLPPHPRCSRRRHRRHQPRRASPGDLPLRTCAGGARSRYRRGIRQDRDPHPGPAGSIRHLDAPAVHHSRVLRLAGAVEDTSGHLLARPVVAAALALESQDLAEATDVIEAAGRGIEGTVEDRRVLVGAASLLRERHPGVTPELDELERRASGCGWRGARVRRRRRRPRGHHHLRRCAAPGHRAVHAATCAVPASGARCFCPATVRRIPRPLRGGSGSTRPMATCCQRTRCAFVARSGCHGRTRGHAGRRDQRRARTEHRKRRRGARLRWRWHHRRGGRRGHPGRRTAPAHRSDCASAGGRSTSPGRACWQGSGSASSPCCLRPQA